MSCETNWASHRSPVSKWHSISRRSVPEKVVTHEGQDKAAEVSLSIIVENPRASAVCMHADFYLLGTLLVLALN